MLIITNITALKFIVEQNLNSPDVVFRLLNIAKATEGIRRPHRLVVRTSRCGRDNPGSTPGVDIVNVCERELGELSTSEWLTKSSHALCLVEKAITGPPSSWVRAPRWVLRSCVGRSAAAMRKPCGQIRRPTGGASAVPRCCAP